MDINPIPYSAFVKEDNSIQTLIDQLTALQDKYVDLLKIIKTDAGSTKKALSGVSTATADGQNTVNAAALGAQRLKRLQEELKLALSETGREIARYKDRLSSATKENSLSAKTILANNQSLKQLKGELGALVKQYEELSAEERLSGDATQQLTDRILFLRQEIKNVTANITLQTKTSKIQAQATTALAAATQKLINAYSTETSELFKIKRETDEVLKIKKLEARATDGTADSYNRLAAQYELNMINLNKYSQEVIKLSPFLKRQQEESKEMRLEMIRLKEATGNHALSVGNYTKPWNGLGMATQQVVREMPAMAISAQTFFIAISNNVPILADEIKNLAAQNKLAAAAGRATTSVWTQLGKSLFSWQTMLVLGLTVLSLYGGKLIELIKRMSEAKSGAESLAKTQKAVNKSFLDADNTYTDTIVKYKVLKKEWELLGNSLDKRTKFVEDNADAFESLGVSITTVNDAENVFVSNSAQFIKALELRAKAEAARALAEKEFQKEVEDEAKREDKAKAAQLEAERLKSYKERGLLTPGEQSTLTEIDSTSLQQLKITMDATFEAMTESQKEAYLNTAKSTFQIQGEQYVGIMTKYLDEADKIAATYGFKAPEDKNKIKKDPTSDMQAVEQENLRIRKRYAESITDLERDELEKQKKQLIDAYTAEMAELRNKQKNEEKLTDESRKLIDQIIYNSAIKLNTDLELLEIDFQQRSLNIEKEGLDLRLSLMERGTVNYYATRNNLLRNQMEFEILENKKQIETLRKDEQAIRDKYGYDILQNEIAMDDMFFEQAQAYQQSEFDLLKHSEYEKNKFRLQQEKDMWTRRLEMAKAGLLQLTDLEIETINNILKALDRQTVELDNGRDIFDLLGLDLDSDQKSAIKEATNFVKEQIGSMLQAEIDLAEIKLQKAQEQVSKAYDFLQLEMEARNEGYANNVENAEKELRLAKDKEAKALQQRKQAQLAQERLNTLEQVSSMITASANIWKTFSTMGPLGIPAAIAAIALMFGSFVGAKVKARQVVNEQAEEYAEGHVELLDGGSHKSGRDIPLGKTKNGKERRAEGGEVFAVVNKRSVSKYGTSKIFDVVNSINKGVFEDKYTNIFSPMSYTVDNQSNDIDLIDIDANVKAIRDQNEYKYHSDSQGLLVERYKNRTRTFKR